MEVKIVFQKNNKPQSEFHLDELVKKILKWFVSLPKAIFDAKFSHNTGTKFLSLLMAILFWFFVMDQVDPEISRVIESVPVQLINTQELDQSNLKIMNQTDYFVNVEVTGRRNNVLSLNSSSISLWADMRTVRGGINNVFINSSINSESVNIKAIYPQEIVLTVDRVVSLPKPVRIKFSDGFQESLYEESLAINPIEIKVTGPESLVNSVSYLGGTIAVNALSSDYTREVSVVPYSFDGEIVSGVTLDFNYTTVTLVIGKTRTVNVIPDIKGEPSSGFKVVKVSVIPETIQISGEIARIDSIQNILTESIGLNGEEDNTFILDAKLVLPEGIRTSGLVDGTVRVEVVIEQIQTKEFTFEVRDIPVVNLSDQFETDLLFNFGVVTVKVTDIESVISEITVNDVRLDFNFSSVTEPGNYRLPG
jgi:YbbR domain-containing protein